MWAKTPTGRFWHHWAPASNDTESVQSACGYRYRIDRLSTPGPAGMCRKCVKADRATEPQPAEGA